MAGQDRGQLRDDEDEDEVEEQLQGRDPDLVLLLNLSCCGDS
jgi:hypothetical protein